VGYLFFNCDSTLVYSGKRSIMEVIFENVTKIKVIVYLKKSQVLGNTWPHENDTPVSKCRSNDQTWNNAWDHGKDTLQK
jgi:predicted  nucleic acid-binding Zn ribbon protein